MASEPLPASDLPMRPAAAAPAPRTLRERLTWDPARGQVCDGPRRYLLMRPDVLMGAVAAMTPAYRAGFLRGWADSTFTHGADSLRAYAASVGGDPRALIDATTEAAADLGWGRWTLDLDAVDGTLHLAVTDSPFVSGWRAATGGAPAPEAVCTPILGMLQALAQALFDAPVQVREEACAANHPAQSAPGPMVPICHFSARRVRV